MAWLGDVFNVVSGLCINRGLCYELLLISYFQVPLLAGALASFNMIVRYCTLCCRKWGVEFIISKGYRQITLGLSTQDTFCMCLHVQDLCGLLHLHKSLRCQCQC